MKVSSLNLIHYSPTGTTKKVVDEIASCLNVSLVSEYDLTSSDLKPCQISQQTLTIIGLPVYAGRLPLSALTNLQQFKGAQSPVVIVVVYGNRAFEDALLELNDMLTSDGFKVLAGAAFIGEHSYSTPQKPIAQGRPDASDNIKCREFAQLISAKLQASIDVDSAVSPTIPGNHPYKERVKPPVSMAPETIVEACDTCGICVEHCPTRALSINQILITDATLCTYCCSCIKHCPQDARIFDNPIINATKERLFTQFSDRREPEFFI